MWMLARYSSAGEKAVYDTVQKMPIGTVIVGLVLFALAFWWLFKKR
jgi:LPXTG-motif cell wall-anchored protein